MNGRESRDRKHDETSNSSKVFVHARTMPCPNKEQSSADSSYQRKEEEPGLEQSYKVSIP